MADAKKPDTPKAQVESILAEFAGMEDALTAFCNKTKSLIEACLEDANIRYQSVQARVKTEKKLKEKYLDPTKDYRSLRDITDLAGLRIITYYEADVDHVAEVIKREFDVDLDHSIDKRNTAPDRFGYSAINYVCSHLKKRVSDVEYKRFANISCEIQITSILRHAWSELEHEWYDLKSAYPDTIKRRFYRIAALLELAESEFLDIRKSRTEFERSVAVRIEANVPDLPVDAVSLRTFCEKEALLLEVDTLVSAALHLKLLQDVSDKTLESIAKAANAAGISSLEKLRELLKGYSAAIPPYAVLFTNKVKPKLPADFQLRIGISIYYLCFILANIQGVEATREYLNAAQLTASVTPEQQVDIAKKVLGNRFR